VSAPTDYSFCVRRNSIIPKIPTRRVTFSQLFLINFVFHSSFSTVCLSANYRCARKHSGRSSEKRRLGRTRKWFVPGTSQTRRGASEAFGRGPSRKRLRRSRNDEQSENRSISLSLSRSLFPPRSYPWKSARRIKEPRKRTEARASSALLG